MEHRILRNLSLPTIPVFKLRIRATPCVFIFPSISSKTPARKHQRPGIRRPRAPKYTTLQYAHDTTEQSRAAISNSPPYTDVYTSHINKYLPLLAGFLLSLRPLRLLLQVLRQYPKKAARRRASICNIICSSSKHMLLPKKK